jgi:uncharacterized protein YegL
MRSILRPEGTGGSQNETTKVYNLIILDESGSMQAIKIPTINGFNELIQSIKNSLKATPEIEQYVNFFSFNGEGIKEHLPLIHASHLKGLNEDNYQPESMTPLYDAIGHAVNKLRAAIANENKYNVLVTILTDGEENASKEYGHKAISALIKDLKGQNWVFTYIGANHDVEKTASSLNINNHLHFYATAAETEKMFNKNSKSRDAYMSRLKNKVDDPGKNFFEQEGESEKY